MKKLVIPVIVIIMISLTFSACKKDEIPPVPVLPPVSSFSMDFDDFQKDKSANLLIENWLYSVTNVAFFNTIVAANMVIPTLAFKESFNHEPVYIGEQTWQWTYDFIGLESTYTARLNGITESRSKIHWEMYIDKTGTNAFTDFLWFEGNTTDTTAANWTVNENPVNPSALFNIEWKSNKEHTESTLKYIYMQEDSDNKNSIIEYGKTPDNALDRSYNIFLTSTESNINIEWSSLNKNGRVKSPNYFKDQNWHCWNEKLIDDWCE